MVTKFVPLACLALTACVTVEAPGTPPGDRGAASRCDAGPAQRFVGSKASQRAGTDIQRLAGASVFQWIPPDTIVTLEYRADRVRVDYDQAMTITGVRRRRVLSSWRTSSPCRSGRPRSRSTTS